LEEWGEGEGGDEDEGGREKGPKRWRRTAATVF